MQGWGCCKGDLDSVEVVDDIPVGGLVLALVAVEEFVIGHFLVQDITTMGFINNDEVIVRNRWG